MGLHIHRNPLTGTHHASAGSGTSGIHLRFPRIFHRRRMATTTTTRVHRRHHCFGRRHHANITV